MDDYTKVIGMRCENCHHHFKEKPSPGDMCPECDHLIEDVVE